MAILKPFHLIVAQQILDSYFETQQPFSVFFADLSKKNKNWGSKDRKIYKSVIYNYFRLGDFAKGKTIESLKEIIHPDNFNEKSKLLDLNQIFKNTIELSKELNKKDWITGFLNKKPVYLKVVLKHKENLENYLKQLNIPFEWVSESGLKLSSDTDCKLLIDSGWAWIMDFGSQEITAMVECQTDDFVWHCCCGGGGKSLFLTNKYLDNINLWSSDLRLNSLTNLKNRFSLYNFKQPHIELIDLMERNRHSQKFDVIVADVPCSGSGTWGRTPENITQFKGLEGFTHLQKTITKNCLYNLKLGGRLYYMTCSVFKQENEAIVEYLQENLKMELIFSQYGIKSFEESDCLFVACLKKTI